MKMETRKVMAIMMMSLIALSLVGAIGIRVNATVSGSMALVRPDLVAPGGAIEVDASDLTITGGKAYFYISKDNDAEISSGDIQFASVDAGDLDESVTLIIPSTLAVYDEYYLKVVDVRGVGKECVVAPESFEVPAEPPTLTIDPVDGVVGDMPTIEGTGATDFITFEFYWNTFKATADYGVQDLDDGDFTVEEDDVWEPILPAFPIPNGFEGANTIVVLFTEDDGTTLTACVGFTLKADISVTPSADYSIEAEAATDQEFTITGTGFPKGTVDKDTVQIIVKDFLTGSTIDTYDTLHAKTKVEEDVEADYGTLEIPCTVKDSVEVGAVTVSMEVDGKVRTFDDMFYASKPTDVEDFTSIKYAKADKNEGEIGDKVKFSFVNLPSGADVVINMIGETVTKEVVTDMADDNGAFKFKYKLEDVPGGDYEVRASVTSGAVTREKKIVTFTVLPTFRILDDANWPDPGRKITDSKVGNVIQLEGKGFPPDSTIKTALFGTKEVDFDDVDTADTGYFLVIYNEGTDELTVPHISGGGLAVTVKVTGEDADGKDISATYSLTIKPKLLTESEPDWDVGILDPEDGTWTAFGDAKLFPGSPVRLVGWGYLGGEAVTVNLYDSDDKLLGTGTITDGETASSKGDLELVCLMPTVKAIYPGGKEEVYLKAAGATSSNNAKLSKTAAGDPLNIDPAADVDAKLYFGMEPDGELKFKKKVGDIVRVVGAGFRTKSLTLTIPEIDEDVKSITASNGAFDTTIVLPEMEGSKDGKEYTLSESETGEVSITFLVKPKIVLTPSAGYSGDKFTVAGTGFEDGTDVDINWLGTAEEENLDTVDGADVDTGSFSIEVEVPTAVAQAYKVKGVVADEEWASATYTIASLFEIQLNKSIQDINNKLAGLDVSSINSNINSLKSDVNTLKSDVATAKDQASAAKTSADAAKTAADTAKTSADSAKTAADTAKTTADAAKTAADGAKTAADNAKTAADNAKTAADNAKASADGLAGLVYAAIAAAAIAAIAAIFAVIQLQRKVAG